MKFKSIAKAYWQLIKSLQTILLVITGIAGYMSGRNPAEDWNEFFAAVITLFLTVAGTTVFNMVWDRDIDAKMMRTCRRPLPSGLITPKHALIFGIIILLVGLVWGFSLNPLYGTVLFAGFFFDFVIYTIWLKRRSPWAIVWGGISGAMPVLAGRVLAIGNIDIPALLLALGILLWIPVHILTFAIKYYDDYARAEIPTFAHVIGVEKTRIVIAIASALSAVVFFMAAIMIGLSGFYLVSIAVLGLLLISQSVMFTFKPTDRLNALLFKSASLFMLLANLFIAIGRMG